jgi:hypothetical protein
MLNEVEQNAIRQWYSQDHVLAEARQLIAQKAYEQLEELLHGRALFSLGRHSELPGFMRNEEGQPLFPTNLDPREDEELWQSAIELGWQVLLEATGLSRADIHHRIASRQDDDWEAFLASVEERKRQRA